MRIEEDCIGKLAIDEDVLYGIHTTRALTNFPISTERTDPLLFKSLIIIKKAAAQVNAAAGTLDVRKSRAIVAACNSLLMGEHQDALVAPAIQGSACLLYTSGVDDAADQCNDHGNQPSQPCSTGH